MGNLSQCKIILNHLEEHGSISSLDAIYKYNIMRLASRMNDLKRKGVKFTTETVYYTNNNNERKHYTLYRLKNEND